MILEKQAGIGLISPLTACFPTNNSLQCDIDLNASQYLISHCDVPLMRSEQAGRYGSIAGSHKYERHNSPYTCFI